MGTHEVDDVLQNLSALVRERYIVQAAVPGLLEQLGEVEVSAENGSAAELAADLTRHLQRATQDRHLRVRLRTSPPATAESVSAGDVEVARFAVEAAQNAGGIRAVELLDRDVGLLRISPYLSPVQHAQPYLGAAFTLLAGVSALVLDLRDGLGGAPETVGVVCGYLLNEESVHLQDLEELGQPLHQYWTVPASHRIAGRIRMLTSGRTFSGCEELAYDLQVLGRATVVGETTGGGAHPVEVFPVSAELELTLPVARAVNARTGTNWEGTGVVPDLPCAATDALVVALQDLVQGTRP